MIGLCFTTSISPLSSTRLAYLTPLFQKMVPNGLPMFGKTIGLVPIIMAILTYIQNKMTIKDPNQKAMIYFMPVLMLAMFNNFPSGLVLYWTLSSALGLVQQIITNKKQAQPAVEEKKNRTR